MSVTSITPGREGPSFLDRLKTEMRTTVFFSYFELKKMSAGSGLGIAWSVLEPLLRVSIYVFVFTVVLGLRLPGAADQPFKHAIYILQGLVPWLYIASCLNGGASMVWTYAGFIRQPAFPYHVLPNLNDQVRRFPITCCRT